ncbi:MAG: helix-turn-helix domain-containing protein, partial [Alistipes sp.]
PIPKEITFAAYDGDQSIYFINTAGGLFRFDTSQRRATFLFDLREEIARRGEVSSIIKDNDDYIVGFVMDGAIRLHSILHIENQYVVQEIAVNCGVFSLFKDRNQDIVWIGTDGHGLLWQSNVDVALRSITYDMLPYPLSRPIKSLFVDREQSLWIGTKNDGILRIADYYRCKTFSRQNTTSFTMDNSPIRKNSIYTFAPSRRNRLWLGGDGGVGYFSYADRKIHLLQGADNLLNIHDILETNDSTLWVATVGHGVFKVQLSDRRSQPVATRVELVELDGMSRATNFFFSIYEESDSVLWFGNHGVGAVRYFPQQRRAERIHFDTRRGLAVNDVTAMTRSSNGVMWFGTGRGLVRSGQRDSMDGSAYHHDVLRNGVIHGLLTDSLDNIWISTNSGIVRYTPQTNSSMVYGNSYGLNVVEFSDGAEYYDKRAGCLFFGGINGLVVISPAEAPTAETYMPPIRFREITTNGVTYGLAGLLRNDNTLQLHYRQNNFSLSLIALDYINGNNYSYLYNIGELDEQWNDNKHNNELTFANLSPDKYTLNVRYRNNITGEMSPIYKLYIRIQPPLYASTGALILYLLAVLTTSFFTIRRYLRRRREKVRRGRVLYEQRQKELLYESRIWSFANLTNELSIPLTLINGPCRQIIDYRSSDAFIRRQAEFIQRNALKINDLIYMLNELKSNGSSDATENIELLDISKFAGGIAQSFSEYAENMRIDYRLGIENGLFFPSARNSISMLLNILLSNAFKRTAENGSVTLTIAPQQELLKIEIVNRGVCIEQERIDLIFDRYRMFDYLEDLSRKGISLKEDMELLICHNLILKLKGELSVINAAGTTTFSILLPHLPLTKAVRVSVQPDILQERPFPLPVPTIPQRATLPTMLVVNKESDMTSFIAELFIDEYNVEVLSDAGSSQEQLKELHPRIIICSTVSLNNELIGLIRQIKTNKHLAQTPIILLTATPDADNKIEGLELGVDICLPLPFNIIHLKGVVEQLLKKYESLKNYGRSIFNSFDVTQGRMLHKDDRAFLDKMLEIIHINILSPELSTQFIADKMSMSLCNLYRKLSGITDKTPVSIIKEYRLALAEQLLLTTKLSIDEIIFKSGFMNRSTFFRTFIARFGSTPKAYREQKIEEALDEQDEGV